MTGPRAGTLLVQAASSQLKRWLGALTSAPLSETMYRTVFDIRDAGYQGWPFVFAGLLFVGAGFAVRKWKTPPRSWTAGRWRLFQNIFFWFAVVWNVLLVLISVVPFRHLRDALDAGQVEIVEGVVEDFVPMPYTGHAKESFTVHRVPFSYSDYIVTSGFNQTESHGGPVHAGCYVRIAHRGGTILRLEIKEGTCPQSATAPNN